MGKQEILKCKAMSIFLAVMAVVIIAEMMMFTPATYADNQSFSIVGDIKENSESRTFIVITKDRKTLERVIKDVEVDATADESEMLKENDTFVAELNAQDIAELEADKGVVSVEEDSMVEASSLSLEEVRALKLARKAERQERIENETNDPDSYNWNMRVINADGVDVDDGDFDKVKVAILDSGVDIVHGIDLADTVNLVPAENEVNPLFLDMTGHGTLISRTV